MDFPDWIFRMHTPKTRMYTPLKNGQHGQELGYTEYKELRKSVKSGELNEHG